MNNTEKFLLLYRYTKALSTALGFRDNLTRLHSDRVVELALALGQRSGLSSEELDILKISAAFHDLGKLGIPDDILLKPGRLSPEERKRMDEHPIIGQQIMLSTELDGAVEAGLNIRAHHEHFDGSGYPDKTAGEDIPIAARIISIVDSYDAMAVTRVYHKARTHNEIMYIIHEESGRKHDPLLLLYFEKLIQRHPLKALNETKHVDLPIPEHN